LELEVTDLRLPSTGNWARWTCPICTRNHNLNVEATVPKEYHFAIVRDD
jgi:hypothetical protein